MTIQKSLYLTKEEELAAEVDVTGTQEENDPLIYICCSHFYDNQFQTHYLNIPQSTWVFVRSYFLM